jgi:hypothetical protein
MGLIGVFVIANGAIIAQMDASLEAIDASDDPSPSIRFRNANLDENAIISFQINAGGTGYNGDGEITATGGTSGLDFMATYTVDGSNAIDSVSIVRYGKDYVGAITFSVGGDSGTPASATFQNPVRGNALFANLTNNGQTSIDVDYMWVSVDGDLPVDLTSIESSTTFGTFFPSETISIIFLEGGLANSVNSISVTANGAVASFGV